MEIHKISNTMALSESPQSERFWLPSASVASNTNASSEAYNPNVRSDEELSESPTSLDHTAVHYSTPEESILRMEDDAPLCSVMEGGEESHSSKKPMSVVFRLSTGKKSRGRKEPRDSLRLPTPSVPVSELPVAFSHLPQPPEAPEDTFLFPDVDSRPPKEKPKKAKMKESKQKKKSEKGKASKKTEEAAETLELPPKASAKKKKRRKKIGGVDVAGTEPNIDKAVIGVTLATALERNPSHDGVPLPAFVRYLIDFIEEYGLAVEGIYRVPGVNSQVKQFINALNNGVEFPDIPPTSPAFLHYDETPKSVGATMLGSREGGTTFSQVAFTLPPPPHDPAVVTSVLKHFLRSLPEPLLTTELSSSIEAVCDQTGGGRRRRLAELVHRELPRVNRYLLAWLLQHMVHVIDRAGDNKMTLSNLVIVFSPTLRMSHRLLALLLQPSPEDGAIIELAESEPTRLVGLANVSNQAFPHWLFPHPAFTYRPYKAPLPPPPPSSEAGFMPFDLPDSLSELEDELFKQESLLTFTHQQIVSGRASAEKDAFIWEVQHLVTKMKRRKTLLELTDPEAIRAELTRHEARLERVQQELVKFKTTEGTAAASTNSGIASASSISVITSPEKASKPVSSRLPVSQFDFVSPLSKRSSGQQKHRAPAVSGQISSSGSLDAEFWELQQTVTMLKRRLKRCQERLSPPTHPPRELIPSESLDTEEVFDFSLRKPATEVVMRQTSAASLDSETRASLPRDGTLTTKEVPTPKVESFPVEWPITPTPCAEVLAAVVMASGDETKKPVVAVEEVRMAQEEEVKLGAQSPPRNHPNLDPASQYLLSICNYWAVRQQELMACQHDLKSRIRSQEAEIARIETCISQMIATGEVREKQVRQYFHENEHLLKVDRGALGRLQMPSSLAGRILNEGGNVSESDNGRDEDEDDDDDDDDDEDEMTATLLQLMRDNARLEALNASHIENIVSERDSCAHLKVRLLIN
ncbi:RalA-binding protein 1 [Taenia solium]|eukprot:TsM_000491700 transcript=TsM_000491700 gene=TsM_000491700